MMNDEETSMMTLYMMMVESTHNLWICCDMYFRQCNPIGAFIRRDDENHIAKDFADLCCSDKDDGHESKNCHFVDAFNNGCESHTHNFSLIQNKLGVACVIMRLAFNCLIPHKCAVILFKVLHNLPISAFERHFQRNVLRNPFPWLTDIVTFC